MFYWTLKRQNTILHTEVPFIETQKGTIARGRKSYLTPNEQKSIFPGANYLNQNSLSMIVIIKCLQWNKCNFVFFIFSFYTFLFNLCKKICRQMGEIVVFQVIFDVVYNWSISLLPPILLDNLFDLNPILKEKQGLHELHCNLHLSSFL